MDIAFTLSSEKKLLFQQLYDELKTALAGLSQTELRELFADAVFTAGRSTIRTKIDGLKKTSKWVTGTIQRYRDTGVKYNLSTDLHRAKEFAASLPEKSQNLYNTFIHLKKQDQIEIIATIIFTLSIFFIAGGGLDFEGGIPDTDIAVGGIGSHRNIISHSIIIGFSIEFITRFIIRLFERLHENLPADHHFVWDRVFSFIIRNRELGIAAMWLGIGTHLLKDSGIFAGNVKPYVGIPGELPVEAHQGLFAINGFMSSHFGVIK